MFEHCGRRMDTVDGLGLRTSWMPDWLIDETWEWDLQEINIPSCSVAAVLQIWPHSPSNETTYTSVHADRNRTRASDSVFPHASVSTPPLSIVGSRKSLPLVIRISDLIRFGVVVLSSNYPVVRHLGPNCLLDTSVPVPQCPGNSDPPH